MAKAEFDKASTNLAAPPHHHHHHHHPPPPPQQQQHNQMLQRHWVPDQRDALIGWLRGEFAAANAIIDALCQHLQLLGGPGEYDFVLGSIQQRRFSWSGILHMQQYFSVAEVLFSLQQVLLRKQQQIQQIQQQQQQQQIYPPSKVKPGFPRNSDTGRLQRKEHRQAPLRTRSNPSSSSSPNEAIVVDKNGSEPPISPPVCCADDGASQQARQSQQQSDYGEQSRGTSPRPLTSSSNEEMAAAQINVEDGSFYTRALAASEVDEVVRSVTQHLSASTGDKTCVWWKLNNSVAAAAPAVTSPELKAEEIAETLARRLKLQGILAEGATPDCVGVHVLEEGRSALIVEQPLCLVSLLAESSISIGSALENVNGEFKGASSNLRLFPGCALKLNGSSSSIGVNASPSIRILLSLLQSSKDVNTSLQKVKQQQQQTSSSNKASSLLQAWPAVAAASAAAAAAAAAAVAATAVQPRAGTGVYIPNSGSGGAGGASAAAAASSKLEISSLRP